MSNPHPRVLVVDDERLIRQQLSRALQRVGIECDCADNGEEALACYFNRRHSMIVTDLRMPNRNGHSLAVGLLEQADPPIVVALTGVMEPRLANDLLRRGVADVVYKPVNYFQLADRLKGMLQTVPSQHGVGAPSVAVVQPEPSRALRASNCLTDTLPEELAQTLARSLPVHRWQHFALNWIDWGRIEDCPSEVHQVAKQLAYHPSHVTADRQRDSRIVLHEEAVVVALDEFDDPVGDPFKVIVRDLSRVGIGFVHTQPLSRDRALISWQGATTDRIIVVARALRCRQVGKFFDIGAMIVSPSTARHSDN